MARARPTIFYSRRIGLSPSREIPVIAGGRLSGKAGPWGIGALTMETREVEAVGVPQTNFTVLRGRRDVLRRSTVGGIFTHRSVSTVAPGANDVWGFDGNFAFYDNVSFSGYMAGSRTEGRSGDDLSYRTQFNYSRRSVRPRRSIASSSTATSTRRLAFCNGGTSSGTIGRPASARVR